MENVFANLGAKTNTGWSDEKKLQKNRRQAFVFITAEQDLSKSAIEDLKKVDGVVELYPSRGAYDIVAKVNGESLEHLSEVILKQIKNLSSIRSTLTLMVV